MVGSGTIVIKPPPLSRPNLPKYEKFVYQDEKQSINNSIIKTKDIKSYNHFVEFVKLNKIGKFSLRNEISEVVYDIGIFDNTDFYTAEFENWFYQKICVTLTINNIIKDCSSMPK